MPVSIALEQQTWMDKPSMASMWLPASPPGLCKQCALGERACVQIRNHLEMGQPPQFLRRPERAAVGGSSAAAIAAHGHADDEWAPHHRDPVELDHRSFV